MVCMYDVCVMIVLCVCVCVCVCMCSVHNRERSVKDV